MIRAMRCSNPDTQNTSTQITQWTSCRLSRYTGPVQPMLELETCECASAATNRCGCSSCSRYHGLLLAGAHMSRHSIALASNLQC